jgi:hypothetical protein
MDKLKETGSVNDHEPRGIESARRWQKKGKRLKEAMK